MSESNIILLLQLFVKLSFFDKNISYDFAKNFIIVMLKKELNIKEYSKYLEIFDHYYNLETNSENLNNSYEKLDELCLKITKELSLKQRIIIILYFLKFSRLYNNNSISELNAESNLGKAIQLITAHFKIDTDDIDSLNAFINNELHNITKKENLIIAGKKYPVKEFKFIKVEEMSGLLKFYYIKSLHVFLFQLHGTDELYLNAINIIPYSIYFFSKSSLIYGKKISTIYFNDLLKLFLFEAKVTKVKIQAKNIRFRYKNSGAGINTMNFSAESGQLIGVLGKSGSGKSTLMRLLTGNLKPDEGEITLNNISIYENRKLFAEYIGYVPQYDALIYELTAYQNLFYFARLWNNSLTVDRINEQIDIILAELELEGIKDRIVGTETQKNISGGERKRLNLALELIRDPKVLFADEPTSGLASSDSETLVRILHEQVLNGRLVIINIHQPSSTIFKTFDKVLIFDSGGFPVYFGSPMLVLETLSKYNETSSVNIFECKSCGNINPEGAFQLLEQKKVDQFGEYTYERKVQPEEWYKSFISKNSISETEEDNTLQLPIIGNKKQSSFQQWLIYLTRNILIKKNDIQYLVVSLITTPILAIVLAFLSKNSSDGQPYLYYLNKNIPSFLLMSVIVALFSGLLSSAEEIHRDKHINARESILNTSKNSYLLSKLTLLFFISALQMLLYVLFSNEILGIKGMTFNYWIILWSLACSANLAGLIISTSFRSVVTIYIFIPFVLIPQIILSGTVIKFENLNPYVSSIRYVPFVGNIMPSRWAFEALAVSQYRDNEFQSRIFDFDYKISNSSYLAYYIIPDLKNQIRQSKNTLIHGDKINSTDSLYIINGFKAIQKWVSLSNTSILSTDIITIKSLKNYEILLNIIEKTLKVNVEQLQVKKDSILKTSLNNMNLKTMESLKMKYKNIAISDLVNNSDEINPYLKINGDYIRLFEPIYNIPASKIGKAHLFAPVKKIGNFNINTYWFNLSFIWLISIILYIILYLSFRTIDIDRKIIITSK